MIWRFLWCMFGIRRSLSIWVHSHGTWPNVHRAGTPCWPRCPCKLYTSLLPSVGDSLLAVAVLRLQSKANDDTHECYVRFTSVRDIFNICSDCKIAEAPLTFSGGKTTRVSQLITILLQSPFIRISMCRGDLSQWRVICCYVELRSLAVYFCAEHMRHFLISSSSVLAKGNSRNSE